ncbi:MAG: phosphoserine phosphatase SerB [Roseovarius sp.]|nr:phosphoserine phosphatase SerB [Roseovarius sp.]MCY4209006.1 phosphoserine phosphatase SerB [Roseovarius sp.]MCY4292447.1 phosphoserine phosphatase SerB [Roseovarius sp.]MCY4315980.1 phosphoserine phosphatase SerB [Roseovarius sp.]
MHTVTLIAPKNGLMPELAENLRNGWGGTGLHWLSPGEAAEFGIKSVPSNQWEIWSELQSNEVDLVVQPEECRRKRMLLADMDSTIVEQECIDELALEAGVGDGVRQITSRAMNGELNFESALRERVALLKGLSESVIGKVLEERITFMPGARELVATMRARGAYTALVSGGFTAFTSQIAAELGFDEHRSNRLLVNDGSLTGKVAEPILGRDAKVAALNDMAQKLGIDVSDAIAVGDGANDLGMLGCAGTGVALHAKPSVAAKCDVRINHGDLTALLFLQGIFRDEFAG